MDQLGIDQIWYTRYATTNDLHLDLAGTRAGSARRRGRLSR